MKCKAVYRGHPDIYISKHEGSRQQPLPSPLHCCIPTLRLAIREPSRVPDFIASLHSIFLYSREFDRVRSARPVPMSGISKDRRVDFVRLIDEFVSLKESGVTYAQFIRDRELPCHVSTLFRHVARRERMAALQISEPDTKPWSMLPPNLLGALIAFYDLHADRMRKKRNRLPVSAIIARFRDWCRKNDGSVLHVSDHQLRTIIGHRQLARIELEPEGAAAYQEIAGRLLHQAYDRLERVQIDATELAGPFITEGRVVKKAYLLVAICIASKMIVAWAHYFRPPRGSDAARLICQILTGHRDDGFRCISGPIGNVQSDNGIFRAKIFQDYLERSGVQLVFTQPGMPVQNGAVEKAIGDVKRGLIYDIEELAGARLERTCQQGVSACSEKNLQGAIERIVDDLNTGVRRSESPQSRWDNAIPFQDAPRDWAARASSAAYIDHWNLTVNGRHVTYDGYRVAWGEQQICDLSISRCFVREYLNSTKDPRLYIRSENGTEQLLFTLHPIKENFPKEEVLPTPEPEYQPALLQPELAF